MNRFLLRFSTLLKAHHGDIPNIPTICAFGTMTTFRQEMVIMCMSPSFTTTTMVKLETVALMFIVQFGEGQPGISYITDGAPIPTVMRFGTI